MVDDFVTVADGYMRRNGGACTAAPRERSGGEPGARLASIEWLRLLAVSAVVYFHVGAQVLPFAMAGVMCFVTVLAAFSMRSSVRYNVRTILRTRARRLIVPWVFWSGVYGLARVARFAVEGAGPTPLFEPWMLLAGTSLHLWFLPWAFVISTLSALAGRSSRRLGPAAWLVLTLAGGALQLGAAFVYPSLHQCGLAPGHLWVLFTPSALIGLALASIDSGVPASRRLRLVVIAVCGLLNGLVVALMGQVTVGLAVALSAGTCALVWGIRVEAGATTIRLGGAAYGIYIVHELIARGCSRVIPGNDLVLRPMIVICASLALVLVLRKSPLRKVV